MTMEFVKLHVSITPKTMKWIQQEAEHRGVSIQELVRAVIFPEWKAQAKPIQPVRIEA